MYVTFAPNPNSKSIHIPSTNPYLTPNATSLQFHIPLTLFFSLPFLLFSSRLFGYMCYATLLLTTHSQHLFCNLVSHLLLQHLLYLYAFPNLNPTLNPCPPSPPLTPSQMVNQTINVISLHPNPNHTPNPNHNPNTNPNPTPY